ncbi:uncharacterized protein LOC122529846 [Frieseomelitta varia]|uniref:uncharacterized protein LOC122529846 n=1 Tax=Frieseomelitta varia TaxID=561572 RepID=UPI001CB689E9|nr:uncharacterized protein LOC122529846 [Frieseomelitta varia]
MQTLGPKKSAEEQPRQEYGTLKSESKTARRAPHEAVPLRHQTVTKRRRGMRPGRGYGDTAIMTQTGLTILQANVNHSARAQDLLTQALTEWNAGLAVVSEPHRVPDNTNWAGDSTASVAILRGTTTNTPPLRVIERSRGFVSVSWGRIIVVGIYTPPSSPMPVHEKFLETLGRHLAHFPSHPTLVLGDFNAKSTLWSSPRTDARGNAVTQWAAGLDLRLLNTGHTSTCIRWQGESIVDLSWASPEAIKHITGWKVMDNTETLSDHLYIKIRLSQLHHSGCSQQLLANSGPSRAKVVWTVSKDSQVGPQKA